MPTQINVPIGQTLKWLPNQVILLLMKCYLVWCMCWKAQQCSCGLCISMYEALQSSAHTAAVFCENPSFCYYGNGNLFTIRKKWVVLTHFGCLNFILSTSLDSFISKAFSHDIIFTNVLENLITVWNVKQQWVSTVFNDAEEIWNWGNLIESKQPFLLWTVPTRHI